MADSQTSAGAAEWRRSVKRVIARYARGNISAQEGRILLPDEQEAERKATAPIARQWRERQKNARK